MAGYGECDRVVLQLAAHVNGLQRLDAYEALLHTTHTKEERRRSSLLPTTRTHITANASLLQASSHRHKQRVGKLSLNRSMYLAVCQFD